MIPGRLHFCQDRIIKYLLKKYIYNGNEGYELSPELHKLRALLK
jgi:hypothetical protein